MYNLYLDILRIVLDLSFLVVCVLYRLSLYYTNKNGLYKNSSIASDIKMTLLILLQQCRYNTIQNTIFSNPNAFLHYHYMTTDHGTYIFEELIFYIKLSIQTRQFHFTQEINQMIFAKVMVSKIDFPVHKSSFLSLDKTKLNRNLPKGFPYIAIRWINVSLYNFDNTFIESFYFFYSIIFIIL